VTQSVPSSGESSSRHVATNPFDARTPSGLGTCMYVRRHTRQTRPAVNDAPPRRSRALLSDRMGRHRAGRGHRTAAGRPFLSAAYTLPQATGGAGVPPPSEFASAAEQWPDAGLRLKFQGALLKLAPPGPARRRLMESPPAACFAVVAYRQRFSPPLESIRCNGRLRRTQSSRISNVAYSFTRQQCSEKSAYRMLTML